MSKNSAAFADSIFNSSFIALVYSLTGWALLESWLLLMHAGVRLQALGMAQGLLLVYLSLKHSKHYRRAPCDSAERRMMQRPRFLGPDTGYVVLLFAIGSLIGVFMLHGGLAILAVLLVSMCFIPWSRVPFCRNRFFSACTAICAGFVLVLATRFHAIDPMRPGMAFWVFWSCSCLALLLRAEKLWVHERRLKRMTSAAESPLLPN